MTAGDKLNLASALMQDFYLLLFPFSSFQDVDFFAWPHFNENYANNLTARIKCGTFYAATAPQLDCFTGNNLENVQGCGGKSFIDVSA